MVKYFTVTEAEKMELINAAAGQAEAVIAAGRARAKSIELVSESLGNVGVSMVFLQVLKTYIFPFF